MGSRQSGVRVTAGPAVDVATLSSAPNVTVHQWLPHAAVLPQAAQQAAAIIRAAGPGAENAAAELETVATQRS